MKKQVLVITSIPSPYQVELFNAVHEIGKIDLTVVYANCQSQDDFGKGREAFRKSWAERRVNHPCLFKSDLESVYQKLEGFDLIVLGGYGFSSFRKIIRQVQQKSDRWCFWGERPGFYLRGKVGKIVRRFTMRFLHNSNAPIWGIGRWAVDRYRSEFGENHVYFNVPYASDLKRFQRSYVTKPKEIVRLFYSGALIYRKGVDLLADVFIELSFEMPFLRLSFMGGGPLEKKLKKKLAQVSDKVDFLGFRSWDELPLHYQNADLFCFPSRHDGWALVIPEALSAGLPVISSNCVGAAHDLVVSGDNGWIFKSNSKKQLKEALRCAVLELLKDPELWRARAVASVEKHQKEDGARCFIEAAEKTATLFSAESFAQAPASSGKLHFWFPTLLNMVGGIQTYSKYLLKAASEIVKGEDLFVCFSSESVDYKHFTFLPGANWSGSVFRNSFLNKLLFVIKSGGAAFIEKPKLIVCGHLSFAYLARVMKFLFGIKYAVVIHGVEAWTITSWFKKNGLQHADIIISASSFTRRRLLEQKFNICSEKTVELANAIETKKYLIVTDHAKLRAKYGFHSGEWIILTVARLFDDALDKGHRQVIDSLSFLKEKIPNVRYVIVGSGPGRQSLEEYVELQGVSDMVFFAGHVSNNELIEYYNLCDVFAMPSKREGFGIVFLEALACGKIVIAKKGDGAWDALGQGELGLFVESDSPEELAALLYQVKCKQVSPRILSSEFLRKEVERLYDIKVFTASAQKILSSFLETISKNEFNRNEQKKDVK